MNRGGLIRSSFSRNPQGKVSNEEREANQVLSIMWRNIAVLCFNKI